MSLEDNHWRNFRKTLVAWKAHVPLRPDAADALLQWTIEVIDAGERLEVALFRKESGDYWDRDELVGWLERRLADERVVDAFEFASWFDRVGSKLAYHGPSGVTEDVVDDVCKLLKRLRPDAAYTERQWSPLTFHGFAINFDPKRDIPLSAATLPSTSVEVGFQTEIWLPWVPGRLLRDLPKRFHDNRALAERHSSRLNDFLRTLRESALVRGGKWEFIAYDEASWLPTLVGPDGVKLDAEAPLMALEHPVPLGETWKP